MLARALWLWWPRRGGRPKAARRAGRSCTQLSIGASGVVSVNTDGGKGVGGENEGGLRALPFGRKAKRGERETERAGSPAAGWRTGREQKAVSAEVTRRSAAEVQSHRPGLADDRARRLPRPSARPSARRVCSGPCSAGSALCPATCAGERGEGFAVTSECRNGFSVLVTQQTEYLTERVRFSGHVSAPVGV